MHYSLLPAEPLTIAQATFPTPLLPFDLAVASTSQVVPRRKASLVPERRKPVPRKEPSPDPADAAVASSADATMPPTDGQGEQDAIAKVDKPASPGDRADGSAPRGVKRKPPEDSTTTPAGDTVTPSTSKPVQDNPQDTDWADPGEPEAEEIRGMTAFYGGEDQVKDRLAGLAKQHWDKTTTVKEGETIINFAYAIRMRSELR